MEGYPEYITKYFKWEDRRYIESGSIKFGNTSEYRSAEDKMTLESRGDKKEGTRERFSFSSEMPLDKAGRDKFFQDRLDYFKDMPPGVFMSRNFHTSVINAWVFCATIGDYDAAHHEKMILGDRDTGYAGNSSLNGWCVFETHFLLRALSFAFRQHKQFSRFDIWAKALYCRAVEYSWGPTTFKSGGQEYQSFISHPQLSDDDVVKQLTTKRKIFATEREFRVIARIDERSYLRDDEPPLIVESDRIRKSVIKMGRFRE